MTKLADLYPLNLETELQRFKVDPTYNPQFTYAQAIDPAFLTKWGLPQPEYVELAEFIINRYLTTHPVSLPKHRYEQTEILTVTQDYFATIPTAPVPPILFNPHQIPRCQVTKDSITFRPVLEMPEADFAGLLRHEIGTHYLRRYNHRLHHLENLKADDQGRTEEGIAILHTYLFHPQPVLYKSALRYVAAAWGQTQSFSQIYNQLRDRGVSHREAWRATLRTKRGLTDTSQPLSFTKDIMYLEGIIKVLRWLQDTSHDPHQLYQGQLSLAQIEAQPALEANQLVLPPFMHNLEKYYQAVESIISYNGLETHL